MTEGFSAEEGNEPMKPAYAQGPIVGQPPYSQQPEYIVIQPQPYNGVYYNNGVPYNPYPNSRAYPYPNNQPLIVASVYPPYQDNICYHVFSCLFCNGCCCGLVGLILACQASSAFEGGHLHEASRLSYQAKRFALMGIFFTVVMYTILLLDYSY